jgi:hypothetical protein
MRSRGGPLVDAMNLRVEVSNVARQQSLVSREAVDHMS